MMFFSQFLEAIKLGVCEGFGMGDASGELLGCECVGVCVNVAVNDTMRFF